MPDTPAQPLAVPDVTLEDILGAGLNELLEQDQAEGYVDMYGKLAKVASDAEAAGELVKARALGFMTAIASMMLTPSEKATPFQAFARWSNGAHSFIPDDLMPSQVDLMAKLADVVTNQLLRARLADLVWLKARKKEIRFPRMAIDAYRAHPINFDTWHMSGEDAWHRALGLAISLGGGAETRAADIEAALIDAFDRSLGADTFEPMFYVRPLYAEKRAVAEAPRIAGELERLGRERLAACRGFDAEGFFSEAGRWYERARSPDKQAEMLVLIGSSYIALAESTKSAVARQEFITRAIKSYRDVPGKFRGQHRVEEIIAELRAKLAAAGRLALGELRVYQGPAIDLTEFTRHAVTRVQGKTPINALMAFCTLHPFPNRQSLYEQAAQLVKQSLIGRLFGGVTLASDGRAIARRFGADNGAAAEQSQVAASAAKSCCEITAMTAYGMIRPALDAMQLESYLTQHDFFHLTAHAGLVPRDRVDVVAKALYAGYCSDYVQAIHILLPQFENMVRVALQDAGAHTTTHDADGLDMEAGLSTLVQRSQMTEVFGDDLTFTIRSIMCEQEGPNLRNAVAHGMADRSLCEGMHGIYAWWLILRLVVESFVADHRDEQANAAAETPAEEV
jgi:hypothetical protein